MKTTFVFRNPFSRGFTLIELMVVISIMALLAGLTFMGFQHAQTSAARSKSDSFKTAIISGLEAYHTEFGEYPQQKGNSTSRFGQQSYNVSGAMMLYQALSGDGTSEMKLSKGGGHPSDGKVDDNELSNIMLHDMPRDMWKKTADGYLLIDGFGKPFQYTKYVNSQGGTHAAADATVTKNDVTVNNTYDLWSFGGDEAHTSAVDLAAKQNPKINGKWIKNW
jgi:prepilin-type N-terminal cleavage/methylation domain-containing protein